MATTKDALLITKWFGNNLYYKEVKETGLDLDTPDTWHPLGHLDAGSFVRKPVYDKIKAEHGQKIKNLLDEDTPIMSGNCLQSDKETAAFLSVGCRDKYFAILRDLGTVNGKQQAIVAPICEFTPQIELVAGTRKPPYEIEVIKNSAAITVPTTELAPLIPAIDANITIGAGDYYYMFQDT